MKQTKIITADDAIKQTKIHKEKLNKEKILRDKENEKYWKDLKVRKEKEYKEWVKTEVSETLKDIDTRIRKIIETEGENNLKYNICNDYEDYIKIVKKLKTKLTSLGYVVIIENEKIKESYSPSYYVLNIRWG